MQTNERKLLLWSWLQFKRLAINDFGCQLNDYATTTQLPWSRLHTCFGFVFAIRWLPCSHHQAIWASLQETSPPQCRCSCWSAHHCLMMMPRNYVVEVRLVASCACLELCCSVGLVESPLIDQWPILGRHHPRSCCASRGQPTMSPLPLHFSLPACCTPSPWGVSFVGGPLYPLHPQPQHPCPCTCRISLVTTIKK